jgi:hypothetical protein
MKLIYKGQEVEASEIRTPSGDSVIGYEVEREILMPQQVQLLDGDAATVEIANSLLKSKRGKDATIN